MKNVYKYIFFIYFRSYIGLLPANPVVVNESDSSESEENGHIQELQNPPMYV